MRGLLIIANYNQAPEIGKLLDRAAEHWPLSDTVVVDDGSSDGSDAIAEKKGFKVIRHGTNRGIGAAIRTGIDHARSSGFQYVVISSSNGKIRPEDLDVVTTPIRNGSADYVQGSRFLQDASSPNLPLFRKLTIPLFSLVTSMILGRRFSDMTCGYRAYTLKVLDDPRMNLDQEWLNRYELEYYIHYRACRSGARITEVPVNIVYSHLSRRRRSKIIPIIGWWSMFRPFIFLALGVRK